MKALVCESFWEMSCDTQGCGFCFSDFITLDLMVLYQQNGKSPVWPTTPPHLPPPQGQHPITEQGLWYKNPRTPIINSLVLEYLKLFELHLPTSITCRCANCKVRLQPACLGRRRKWTQDGHLCLGQWPRLHHGGRD